MSYLIYNDKKQKWNFLILNKNCNFQKTVTFVKIIAPRFTKGKFKAYTFYFKMPSEISSYSDILQLCLFVCLFVWACSFRNNLRWSF